jgi:hypothetical protein
MRERPPKFSADYFYKKNPKRERPPVVDNGPVVLTPPEPSKKVQLYRKPRASLLPKAPQLYRNNQELRRRQAEARSYFERALEFATKCGMRPLMNQCSAAMALEADTVRNNN